MDDCELECRLCMRPRAKLSIFNNPMTLVEELQFCCGIQVSPDDGLPTHICYDCAFTLNESSNFKRRCINMDKVLREKKETVSMINENIERDTAPDKLTKQLEDALFNVQIPCSIINTNTDPIVFEENTDTDPIVVEENIDTDPIVVEENIDTEPIVVEENIDTDPIVVEENINTDPIVVEENIDTDPIVVEENIDTDPIVVEENEELILDDLMVMYCDKNFHDSPATDNIMSQFNHGKKLSIRIKRLDNIASVDAIYCAICVESFVDNSKLKKHLAMHNKKIICKQCGIGFNTRYFYTLHNKHKQCTVYQKENVDEPEYLMESFTHDSHDMCTPSLAKKRKLVLSNLNN